MDTIKFDNITNEWYSTIELGVRDYVFLLRNSGFNTECSCEHEKYIQCQYIEDGEIERLVKTLYTYMYNNNIPINFQIEIVIKVDEGHLYNTLNIYF